MNSRLIFESSKTYLNKIQWAKPQEKVDSEWVHFRTETGINRELINKIIHEHFKNVILYCVLTRNDSFEVDQELIETKIIGLIDTTNFILWNTDFKLAMQFDKIGVLRKGEIAYR